MVSDLVTCVNRFGDMNALKYGGGSATLLASQSRAIQRLAVGMAWLAIMMCSGCGGGYAVPSNSDRNVAKRILSDSLQAWRDGKTLQEQRELTPPVYVADEQWLRGASLESFTVEDEGEEFGPSIRFWVTLVSSAPQSSAEGQAAGRSARKRASQTRKVRYIVATVPAYSVARED